MSFFSLQNIQQGKRKQKKIQNRCENVDLFAQQTLSGNKECDSFSLDIIGDFFTFIILMREPGNWRLHAFALKPQKA